MIKLERQVWLDSQRAEYKRCKFYVIKMDNKTRFT